MTKEEKARIARENGAKSKGPKTQEGKDRSRANALAHGRRAQALRHFVDPHTAVLCTEDGRAFYKLFHDSIAFYRPLGSVSLDVVREITVARWELTRVQMLKTAAYNRALIHEHSRVNNVPPDLFALECAVNAANAFSKSGAELDRTVDRLLNRIARLERRLRFLNASFPSLGNQVLSCQPEQERYERTDAEPAEPIDNTASTEEPLITDDPSELTRATYEFFFPGRELIVIEPPPPELETDPDDEDRKPN